MTNLEKRPNRHALFGTIGIWLLLSFLSTFSSLLPHKKVYKTVKISLESPATPKIAPLQEAAPPQAENTAQLSSSQSSSSQGKTETAKTKTSEKQPQTKKAETKTAKTEPAKKQSQTKQPSSKPARQTLQKSVDELMAERQKAKNNKKKDFDWSQLDDADEVSSSGSSSSSTNTSAAKTVNTFEGTAGSSSSSSDQGVSASSNKSSSKGSASASTAGALASIAATSYSTTAGNGVKSQSNVKIASAPDGRIALYMNDGSKRTLLEPAKPVIFLSENAAATIDATKDLRVTFIVKKNGHVDMNSISITPSALITYKVQAEIQEQISTWRFNADSADATATFPYRIEKR